jgi:Rrf2 family protein
MFSQTVEYALRAVVVLANHPDEPRTVHQIAEACQVPPDYLGKVLQALGRAGLVSAQRGKHGGFTLRADTHTLSILDVVNAVDPIRRITRCPLGIAAHGRKLCPLHRRLDAAMAAVESALGASTLAEMLEEPAPLKPLCGGLTHVAVKTV